MAADVAGYSRLMGADENATVIALDAARAVFKTRIESTQGRVIDMAGDSVLAVFEAATGAVSTALAIQDELRSLVAEVSEDRRMLFRIGAVARLLDLVGRLHHTRDRGSGVVLGHAHQGVPQQEGSVLFRPAASEQLESVACRRRSRHLQYRRGDQTAR